MATQARRTRQDKGGGGGRRQCAEVNNLKFVVTQAVPIYIQKCANACVCVGVCMPSCACQCVCACVGGSKRLFCSPTHLTVVGNFAVAIVVVVVIACTSKHLLIQCMCRWGCKCVRV